MFDSSTTITELQEKPVLISSQKETIMKFPWQEKISAGDKPVWRYRQNPVICNDAVSGSNSIFNSAIVPFKNGFAGIFRCDNNELTRTLNIGFSSDGINWEISDTPISFVATKENLPECCQPYDPRITEIDGRYFITWCNVYHGPTLGLGYTDDFKTFYMLEPMTTPYNRNGVLFPKKINGKYALLSRPSGNGHCEYGEIFYSESPDLEHWGCHRFVMGVQSGWQDTKIGAGPPPIETPDGWLLFYHGVKSSCSGFVYRMGVALLELENPCNVIAKAAPSILSPKADYERMGDVPNVVFPCAALHDQESGRIAIYYGAADTCTCLAFTTVDEIMDFIKKNRNSIKGSIF